jgi:hypothetical protein
MRRRLGGVGLRVSLAAQSVFRSWWTLAGFLTWTAAWWTAAFALGRGFVDPWPLVGWTTLTTLWTQLDVNIVGIGQKQQQHADSQKLVTLVQLGEAQARSLETLHDLVEVVVEIGERLLADEDVANEQVAAEASPVISLLEAALARGRELGGQE